MKHILFLHHARNVGGAEKMRLMLLRGIDRSQFKISVCFLGEKGIFGEEIERLGYMVDELRQNPDSKSPYVTYKLAEYLTRKKPDILHSCLFNANFHGRIAGLLCRVPNIITEEHGEYKEYNGLRFFPYVLSDFFLSKLSDFIICCSEKVKEDIIKKEGVSRRKIVYIDNCLDVNKYPVKLARQDIRKRHCIGDEMVFIAVASLKAGKGHDYLIEVLRDVKNEGYKFKCFFAGSGPLREKLLEICDNLGLSEEIIFLGRVEDIADYLNASDVFILPSFSEGHSIALMEAMLMGLASIVTNVGANADLVKRGFNGMVIPPGDKGMLKDAILFYLQNRDAVKEFGEKSKSVIKEKYSLVNKYIRQYYELWDKCVKN